MAENDIFEVEFDTELTPFDVEFSTDNDFEVEFGDIQIVHDGLVIRQHGKILSIT